ncbi:NAD(P)H-dependent oxidoreductase [Streptomyces sp. ET3-23]|uniref:NADPH-dependent FMN reductase n=1 Tax=Streptomyces sp. ET3-23 TaxID=2885643 RepID=UPI001D0F625E|nr:NAD(P)H-dependent oxidoreductase [Streptomyces sp. ET3-23]MCC2274280.1 NAD(P)H-dependent oxidoreductase [Streptomyces sp. ET3-23]
MKITAISGSLRARSANGIVLRTALELTGAEARTADIGSLPHFNPDLDGEGAVAPAPVAALRSAVAEADAVLIVSPEYAHGVPGVLKNALDWLVSSGEFIDKPVGVVTASPSPSGGDFANAQLRETLRMMTGAVVDDACLCIGLIATRIDQGTGRIVDEATLGSLSASLKALESAASQAGCEV